MRVLGHLKVWLPLVAVVAALSLVYFANLAAVVSPGADAGGLPVALVNEDRGAILGGEKVDFGGRVVENATAPDSPAADAVEWARPEGRAEALEGLGRKEYYGAIVIPADYSEKIAGVAGPPDVPMAVVNEDAGAELGGKPVNLGEEVADRIASPDSPAPPFVGWTTVETREDALRGIERGAYYAAVMVPEDYSRTLAGVSGPPPGVPSGAPSGARSPAPEPAEIKLLTSPSARPSTTGLIENVFSGILGGVSDATSERVLAGLSERGAPVPPGAGAVISDPVRGETSEADVPASAGPLPRAPEPAEIEVLTNAAAGQAVAGPAQSISVGLVEAVSRATSERLSGAAGERGAQLTPEVAAVVGDPVRAEVTQAQPVGPRSGGGQSPFFLAFLANISGIVGAAVIFFGVGGAADALASGGRRPSRAGLWSARLLMVFVYAAVAAGAELGVAFGLLGVGHGAGAGQVWAFIALAVAVTATLTLLLAAALGPVGIAISAVLNVILGLVSSGGLVPLEALPGFYRVYADWLPLRYSLDGLRSLLLYDGRPEAGLAVAVGVLGAYLAGGALLGYAFSLARDRFFRQRKQAPHETGERGAARAPWEAR